MEEEYPSNSIVKEQEKKVKSVVTGKVVKRKQPFLDRIVTGETSRRIWEYILWDVLVPAAKSTFSDIVTNAVDMTLYGSEAPRRRSNKLRRSGERTFVSYSDYYNRDDRSRSRSGFRERETPRTGSRHHFEEVIFETRADAEEVLSTLVELVEQYGVATVADFYDASGSGSQYTDRNYGWESLAQTFVRPVRGGFVIDLPRPLLID